MGKIIADIFVGGSAKGVGESLFEVILPKPKSNVSNVKHRVSKDDFSVSCFGCRACGRDLAMVLQSKKEGEEIHLILNHCTRMVAGIHPEVREREERRFGATIPFTSGESRYFCGYCTGMKTPERICNSGAAELVIKSVKLNLESRLHQSPICDMREYDPARGCWLTVTEFLPDGRGRFMNLQAGIGKFACILLWVGLISHEDARPFLRK